MKRRTRWSICIAAAAMIGLPLVAQTNVVTYTVSLPVAKNTWLDRYNTASHADSAVLYCGRSGYAPAPAQVDRDLLLFSFTNIPATATILSANLRLALAPGNTSMTTISVHRATGRWASTQATWYYRISSTAWTTEGGDYTTPATTMLYTNFTGSDTARVEYTFTNLAADVEFWLRNPDANNGWGLINSDETTLSTFKQIWGRNHGQSFDAMPYLDVTYRTDAKVVSLPPDRDTYLDSFNAWTVNGGGSAMYMGRTAYAGATQVDHIMLAFPLTNIVPRSTILAANLRLAFNGNHGTATTTGNMYRVTGSGRWAENQACWNNYDAGKPWLTPGGDYATPTTTTLVADFLGANGERVDFNFTNLAVDVQTWLDNTNANNGWILINSDETTLGSYKGAWSREHGQSFDATPYLDVTYREWVPQGTIISIR